ncbi:hypothetical protein PVAG01_04084 [Phlyctema vagabunda]|uniref:Uncharacterized protein n=1 Tax=Phlyctema vagabunda TaxID=108571 RepID=A0ABR4PN83_9HELO
MGVRRMSAPLALCPCPHRRSPLFPDVHANPCPFILWRSPRKGHQKEEEKKGRGGKIGRREKERERERGLAR